MKVRPALGRFRAPAGPGLISLSVLSFLFWSSPLHPANQEKIAPQPNQDARQVRTWSLLVIPANQFSQKPQGHQKEEWISILEQFPDLRLTLACSPQSFFRFSPEQDRLIRLQDQGRIELALRLNGDPPLPLIYNLDLAKMFLSEELPLPSKKMAWEEEIVKQIVRNKVSFKQFFGKSPKGFVPGGGSLSLPIVELLKKYEFEWAVANFPISEWPEGETLSLDKNGTGPLVVFKAHAISNSLYNFSDSTPQSVSSCVEKITKELKKVDLGVLPVVIFDENRSRFSLTDFLSEYRKQTSASQNLKMALCSEAKEQSAGRSSTIQLWPYSWEWLEGAGFPRGPGLTAWIGDHKKNQAWDLLSQTKTDLEEYKNSGQAVLEKLDLATEEFYLAAAGEFFEWFGEENPASSKQQEMQMLFKATLANVYRHLELPLPAALRNGPRASGDWMNSGSTDKESTGEPNRTERKFALRNEIKDGSVGWIQTQENNSANSKQEENKSSTQLKKFFVTSPSSGSEPDLVRFQVSFKNLVGRPVVHTYIDINHRAGAGSNTLLLTPAVKTHSTEGWEFALVSQMTASKRWEHKLFRSNSAAPIARAESGSLQSSTQAGPENEIYFEAKIPKKNLGENPLGWGYLVCLGQEGTGAGHSLSDFLSPIENKDSVLSKLKTNQENALKEEQVLLPMMRARAR